MQSLCDKAGLCRDAQLVLNELVWLSEEVHPHEHGSPPRKISPAEARTQILFKNLTSCPQHRKGICCELLPYGFWPGWFQCACDFLILYIIDSVGFTVVVFSSYPGRRDVAGWKSTFWWWCRQQQVRWFELRDSLVLSSSSLEGLGGICKFPTLILILRVLLPLSISLSLSVSLSSNAM